MVELSIIIPTFNEEEYLPRLLESIERQWGNNREIIIADNNSTDKTVEIAKRYGARIVEGGLPAVARNNGARAARGEYLLFVDADTVMPDGFLKSLLKQFDEDFIDICIPVYKPIDSDKKIYKTLFELANSYLKLMEFIKPQGGGACILVTRRLHRRIGGFEESRRTSEDHDYIFRASEIGRFRVYNQFYIYVSARRLEVEGLSNMIQKMIRSSIVFFFTGKSDEKIDYEYGKFSKELIAKSARMRTGRQRRMVLRLLSSFNRIRHKFIRQLTAMGVDESVLRVGKRYERDKREEKE